MTIGVELGPVKRYGAEILGILPGCRIFRDLRALERFFNPDEYENDE